LGGKGLGQIITASFSYGSGNIIRGEIQGPPNSRVCDLLWSNTDENFAFWLEPQTTKWIHTDNQPQQKGARNDFNYQNRARILRREYANLYDSSMNIQFHARNSKKLGITVECYLESKFSPEFEEFIRSIPDWTLDVDSYRYGGLLIRKSFA
jgi:hypothetical protein